MAIYVASCFCCWNESEYAMVKKQRSVHDHDKYGKHHSYVYLWMGKICQDKAFT